jgi:hypothetical protein
MFRNVRQQVVAPELMLLEAVPGVSTPASSAAPSVVQKTPGRNGICGAGWLAALALNASTLDPASWQTRAARGLSWNSTGKLPQRRIAH